MNAGTGGQEKSRYQKPQCFKCQYESGPHAEDQKCEECPNFNYYETTIRHMGGQAIVTHEPR